MIRFNLNRRSCNRVVMMMAAYWIGVSSTVSMAQTPAATVAPSDQIEIPIAGSDEPRPPNVVTIRIDASDFPVIDRQRLRADPQVLADFITPHDRVVISANAKTSFYVLDKVLTSVRRIGVTDFLIHTQPDEKSRRKGVYEYGISELNAVSKELRQCKRLRIVDTDGIDLEDFRFTRAPTSHAIQLAAALLSLAGQRNVGSTNDDPSTVHVVVEAANSAALQDKVRAILTEMPASSLAADLPDGSGGFEGTATEDANMPSQADYERAEREAANAAKQWRVEKSKPESDADTLETLRENLHEAVREAFQIRQARQRHQIESARRDLSKIESELKRRDASKQLIISRRIQELIEGGDLSWLAPSPLDATDTSELSTTTSPLLESISPSKIDANAREYCKQIGVHIQPARRPTSANKKHPHGLVLTAVMDDSLAQQAGLNAGDVLIGLMGLKTTSMSDLDAIATRIKASRDDSTKFYIVRRGQTLFGHIKRPTSDPYSVSASTQKNPGNDPPMSVQFAIRGPDTDEFHCFAEPGSLSRFHLGILSEDDVNLKQVQAILEAKSLSPDARRWAEYNQVPIQISVEDLGKLRSGDHLTKVVYLKRGTVTMPLIMDSIRLDPGIDPVHAAEQRGEVIAILRLIRKPPQRGR